MKSKREVCIWGLLSYIKVDKGNVKKQPVPMAVKLPNKNKKVDLVPIKCQSCNHGFLVLTECGKVFSWGSGKSGRLGHGDTSDQLLPKQILWFSQNKIKVVDLFSQVWNAAAIDAKGSLYVWGNIVKSSTPVKIHAINNVKKVSVGCNFLLGLTTAGKLFSFGRNAKYQCGVKEPLNIGKPIFILKKKTFRDVDCGYVNGVAITEDGKEVWVWGANDCGQLLTGKTSKYPKLPRKITISKKDLTFAQCSFSNSDNYCHAGVVTEDGECYMWGNNYKAKLANGNTDAQLSVPVKITSFKEKDTKVKNLLCGGIHNFLTDTNKNLYSFGCGSDGRLGHIESNNYVYLYKEIFPRKISTIQGKVIDAHTSYYSGIAIVEKDKKKAKKKKVKDD